MKTQTTPPAAKKNWTIEDWKNSPDVIDRTVWFIASLSPHNLWKGEEAIKELIEASRKEVLKKIKDNMFYMVGEENRGRFISEDRLTIIFDELQALGTETGKIICTHLGKYEGDEYCDPCANKVAEEQEEGK